MSYADKKCKNCEYFRCCKRGKHDVIYYCKMFRTEINSIGLCASFEPRKEYRNEHIRSNN